MTEIQIAEQVEAAASRDMYAAAPASMGFGTRSIAGATVLLAPGVPVSYFNRVIGLGDQQPATESDLDAAIACFRDAGVGDFWIHLTPTAQPKAIEGWLKVRGFAPPARRSWAKFLRGVEAPAPVQTSVTIRPATVADAEAVAMIASSAYGMPPALGRWIGSLVGRPGWHFLLALLDGKPVGNGALFHQGRSGWLGVGSTLAEARGRGAQSALLAARIALAAKLGCTTLVTETGEPIAGEKNPSLANIRRSGFRQVCSRLNFAAPAPPK